MSWSQRAIAKRAELGLDKYEIMRLANEMTESGPLHYGGVLFFVRIHPRVCTAIDLA